MEITFFANIPNDPSNKKCHQEMLANEFPRNLFESRDQFGPLNSRK
jgi:hypothetical protein